MLVGEHEPDPIAPGLRERGRHALRQMADAVALIDQTKERRTVVRCDRAEALRRLPRTMQQHRPDQIGRVLTERLR